MSDPAKSSSYRWIPWSFVLLFLPVMAVNILLVRLAFSSNTGLVSDHAFDTGQSYNQVIAAGEQSRALGWRSEISLTASGPAHQALISLSIRDRNGHGLSGLAVSGRLYSPVDPQPDQMIHLTEDGDGHYSQTLLLPRQGQWDAQLLAASPSGRFAIDQRLILR
jgi:nitrogen fixation protein FixH